MASMLPQLPQSFSLAYDGITNRIISEISVFKYFNPANVNSTNILAEHRTTALWDTGATNSIITQDTAKSLSLTPIGKTNTNHGGGQSEHFTHYVNIGLPNKLLVTGVTVTEMDKIVDNFGVIIGMDIISQGDFSLTNFEGKTLFSFRIPSLTKVDYVQEFNNYMQGIRGHDKCPCRSGKKYRKCHGNPMLI